MSAKIVRLADLVVTGSVKLLRVPRGSTFHEVVAMEMAFGATEPCTRLGMDRYGYEEPTGPVPGPPIVCDLSLPPRPEPGEYPELPGENPADG